MLQYKNFIRGIKSKQEGLRAEIKNISKIPFYFRLHGKINYKVVDEFKNLITICQTTNQNILPIVINSTGGSPYSLINLYKNIQKSKIKIATIVESKALSAGAFLLCFGTKGQRYMDKDAIFMLHNVRTFDNKPDLKEIKRLNLLLCKLLEKKTTLGSEQIKKIMINYNKSPDFYLNAEQCLKYKIIDFIGIPTLKLKKNEYNLFLYY